ncbi:MAG: aa3-type cytochrome c oxidase subunit IV [Gemmatimonas sp.]
MATELDHHAPEPDVAEHERTFENFTKGMAIFAAHVGVILLLLAAVSL